MNILESAQIGASENITMEEFNLFTEKLHHRQLRAVRSSLAGGLNKESCFVGSLRTVLALGKLMLLLLFVSVLAQKNSTP